MNDHDLSRGKEVVCQWHTLLLRGADYDLWGQQVEAIDCYTRLAANLRLESSPAPSFFSDQQKKILNKVAACVELRIKALQSPGKIGGMNLDDLKSINPYLRDILTSSNSEFPLNVSGLPQIPVQALTARLGSADFGCMNSACSDVGSVNSRHSESVVEDEENYDDGLHGTLLPLPEAIPGHTYLTIYIDRIGIKDAPSFLDPFITVSVKDENGKDLSSPQDTPICGHKTDNYIFLGVEVHIQKSLECFPTGHAIVFEFKHYKPKKKSVSTKCWAFLEKDEMKEGEVALELYKKPADPRRKKLHLMTVKPLYLHAKLIMI